LAPTPLRHHMGLRSMPWLLRACLCLSCDAPALPSAASCQSLVIYHS
jgi:hypothetical protein